MACAWTTWNTGPKNITSSRRSSWASNRKCYPQAPLGVVYPTDNGVLRTIAPNAAKWAPRIGLAWSPNNSDGILGKIIGGPGKTSIRAGFGMFYSVVQGATLAYNLPQPPYGLSYTSPAPSLFAAPFQTAADGSFAGNPFPFAIPPLNTSKSNPDPKQSFDAFLPINGATGPNPQNTYPYNEQYFFSIERQLSANTVLNVSYVGSQAHHLLLTYSVNPGNPALCLALSTPSQVAPGSATCGPFGESGQYTSASGQVSTERADRSALLWATTILKVRSATPVTTPSKCRYATIVETSLFSSGTPTASPSIRARHWAIRRIRSISSKRVPFPLGI